MDRLAWIMMSKTDQLLSTLVVACLLAISTDGATVATTTEVQTEAVTWPITSPDQWPANTNTPSPSDLTFSQLLAIICLGVLLGLVITILCAFCLYMRGHIRDHARLMRQLDESDGQYHAGTSGHKVVAKKAHKYRGHHVSWDPRYQMGDNYFTNSDPYHVGPIAGGHHNSLQPINDEDYGGGPMGVDFDPFGQGGQEYDPFGQGREPFNPYAPRH